MRIATLILAVVAASASVSAFAVNIDVNQTDPANPPALSRSQVHQELLQAEGQGMTAERNTYPVLTTEPSHMTRQQVKAELQQYERSGADHRMYDGA